MPEATVEQETADERQHGAGATIQAVCNVLN